MLIGISACKVRDEEHAEDDMVLAAKIAARLERHLTGEVPFSQLDILCYSIANFLSKIHDTPVQRRDKE